MNLTDGNNTAKQYWSAFDIQPVYLELASGELLALLKTKRQISI